MLLALVWSPLTPSESVITLLKASLHHLLLVCSMYLALLRHISDPTNHNNKAVD